METQACKLAVAPEVPQVAGMALGRRNLCENELPLRLQVAFIGAGPLQNMWVLPGKWHQHISTVSRRLAQGEKGCGQPGGVQRT